MKRRKKRWLTLLLAVLVTVMLFVCLAAVAYAGATDGKAARIGVNCYNTLPEAVAAATDGQTIKLLTNVKLSDSLVFNRSVRIDLNGKQLTGPNTGNDYIFELNTNGIEVSVIGEGTVYVYSNVQHTYEGMVKIASGCGDATFNLAGSFDGITLLGENCAYVAATVGNINVSNVKAYTPKNGTSTVLGLFNARTNVKLSIDRVVVYKTEGPNSTNIPSRYDSVFNIYDCATTTITNSYVDSPKKGLTIRHDGNLSLGAAAGRRYLTVDICTI